MWIKRSIEDENQISGTVQSSIKSGRAEGAFDHDENNWNHKILGKEEV